MMRVYFEGRTVGEIRQSAGGPEFVYDPDWYAARDFFPVSTGFPRPGAAEAEAPVPPARLVPWLANLLPEGDALAQAAHIIGAAQGDVLAMVGRMGRDTSGALSFRERGQRLRRERPIPDEAALERIIEELPRKPFLVGEEGVALSLAGAQTKMALVRNPDGSLGIPIEGSPSTHILKPDVDRLYGSVASEALAMTLARACGLAAAEVTTGHAGKREYLLVTRYDRVVTADAIGKLHQEDFCQALGVFPAMKYQANQTGTPGPSFADIAGFLAEVADPRSRLRFLDAMIFNALVCNPDAHAKNYSLLIHPRRVELAPLYDLVCAEPWEGINQGMAMKIAGKRDGAYLKGRHWQREAVAWGLNPTLVLRRVEALGRLVLRELDGAAEAVAAMPAGRHPYLSAFAAAIGQRTEFILNGLKEVETA